MAYARLKSVHFRRVPESSCAYSSVIVSDAVS